jgi:hypothetical protein
MKEWLPVMATALGVSLAQCKKDQGTTHAREVPAPTFTIPAPHDTICSVSVVQPAFVVGVGGDVEGVCYGAPCSDRKPWKPNLRAVVRAREHDQSQLAAP